MSTDTAGQHSARDELFGPERRAVTVGIVLLISLVAFEAMGVGTAMPAIVGDLGSIETYAWPFVAFIATTVVGTVIGGRWCDARGPRWVLLAGPPVFGAGLLLAGLAGTMGLLLAGRALQGLAAGAQGVAIYVLIAQVYSPRARPAVFGLVSAAWVLPALIGPPVSGYVTDRWSWHWVFLGLLPLVALAAVLLLPVARRAVAPERPPAARPGLVPAALVAACAVALLTWSGEDPRGGRLVLAAGSAAVLVGALLRLFPSGTTSARDGIAAVVACRWLISAAFFTTIAYLPLMLTATHGWSITAAGVPLIVGSLGWSVAAAWQGRHPDLQRHRLLRLGFVGVTTGLTCLLLVTPEWGWPWLSLPAMALTGLGMGLGFSSLSFLLLAHSEHHEVGFNTSSTQLADQMSQAVFIALGGAMLALLATPTALSVLVVALAAMATLGLRVSGRTAATSAAR